jgi:hypothetical protein
MTTPAIRAYCLRKIAEDLVNANNELGLLFAELARLKSLALPCSAKSARVAVTKEIRGSIRFWKEIIACREAERRKLER